MLRFFRSPAFFTESRALWALAWPMLIGQLATVGMGVADVAMAGHASANDLAAVSLGTSIWGIVLVTMMGIMMSINPIVAHHVGAAEFAQIPSVTRQALWKGLLVGAVAFVLANAASLIFDSMQLQASVRDMSKSFVQVISFGLPAFACYRVLYGYSASLGQTKPMMVIALAALALNVLLNWLLIYGHFGLPRLGGLGCAYATLACVWFNFMAMLWWIKRQPYYQATSPLRKFEAPQAAQIRKLLRLGLPIGITYFAESSAFCLIALLVAKFGAAEVSAHQIALNFSSLVFMVPMSIGIALMTRVGHALGEGEPRQARFRAWVGVSLAFGFACASAALIAIFNQQIANAYTNDLAVAALAAHLLIFAALFQLSDATQVSTSCAIRAYKVTRPPMVIHMLAFWGFSLPLGGLLGLAPDWLPWAPSQPMAASGFWIALVVGLTVAALGLTYLLARLSKQSIKQASLAENPKLNLKAMP